MINNKIKKIKNTINSKIIINAYNNINSKNNKDNQDLIFNDFNNNIDIEIIASKHFKTISFNHTNNNISKNLEEQNKNNLNHNSIINNKETFSEEKLIQTYQNFNSIDNVNLNLNLNDKIYIPNIMKIKKERINYLKNKYSNNKRVFSALKQNNFSNNFFKNFKKFSDSKTSRNELYLLINKQKESAIKTYFQNLNLLKESNSSNSNSNNNNNQINEKKRKHKNLLTIENIYSQRKISQKYFKTNEDNNNKNKNKNRIKTSKLSNLKKKYSINEIKFPINNNINTRYKILNDNNDYLIEEIFKRQTTSNFNNKYTLKLKISNNIKKENIKNLFSLLKKYKYSDKDKQTAFCKYNSFKNKMKNNLKNKI